MIHDTLAQYMDTTRIFKPDAERNIEFCASKCRSGIGSVPFWLVEEYRPGVQSDLSDRAGRQTVERADVLLECLRVRV